MPHDTARCQWCDVPVFCRRRKKSLSYVNQYEGIVHGLCSLWERLDQYHSGSVVKQSCILMSHTH